MEWTIPAFAFPAEAGTHLPTPEGWTAMLALKSQVLQQLEQHGVNGHRVNTTQQKSQRYHHQVSYPHCLNISVLPSNSGC